MRTRMTASPTTGRTWAADVGSRWHLLDGHHVRRKNVAKEDTREDLPEEQDRAIRGEEWEAQEQATHGEEGKNNL